MSLAQLLSLLPFLSPLLDKLQDAALDAFVSFLSSLSSVLFGPESELAKLTRTRLHIRAFFLDADRTRFSHSASARLWLSQLRSLALDADDLLDEFCTRTNIFKIRNPSRKRKRPNELLASFALSWSISRRISEINELYDEIAENRKKLQIRDGEPKRRAAGSEDDDDSGSLRHDLPFVHGFDRMKAEVKGLLRTDGRARVEFVSIVGEGGVGKTTLAQLVFDDSEMVSFFPNLRVWVGISVAFDVKMTLKAITESITGESCKVSSLELLQRRVHQLVNGNKFLLVLDGVWNERLDFFEALKASLMSGAEGSRVLVATRSEVVSRSMRTLPPVRLTGLEDEECWLVFRDNAFQPGAWDQHPHLVEIGREIARKCKGSPLAAKSLGSLLYMNTDDEEWTSVMNDIPDEDGEVNTVMEALMVSYEHLPLHLKQCFAFCSVFPSGYRFDRDELVKIWMGVGLVEPRGRRSLENVGGRYFDYLLWRSFFQISDGCLNPRCKYVMPSVIHELAQSVASHECFRAENEDPNGEARYALLSHPDLEVLEKLYECEKIRACLFLGENGAPSKIVPDDLLQKLRCLRVLDLRYNEVAVLPDSIGDLIHLRYINLQGTKIERLPESVSNLYNLQTLELGECDRLKELPKGTSNLVNLRHLGLHLNRAIKTDLICMPPGMGKLTSLRTLSRFVVSSESGCGIDELKDLNLRGELCISKLENVTDVNNVKLANLNNKRYIDVLTLRWTEGSSAVFQDEAIKHLRPHTRIKQLFVDNYNGQNFPDWMDDSSFINLETVRLYNCKRCEVLPMLGRLPRLKNLRIEALLEVKSIAILQGPPVLEELLISDCPKLSELPDLPPSLRKIEVKNCKEVSALPILPSLSDVVVLGVKGRVLETIRRLQSLRSLTISQLADLKSVPENYFRELTSLRNLRIEGCKKLASVTGHLRDLSSLETLEVSSCPKLSSFAEEGLPLGVKEFHLSHCGKVASLPRGLHLLSSLQCMEIQSVPLLSSLPNEGLPAQLMSLSIDGCPTLQQRCRRGGADWLKIEDVPFLEIGNSQPTNP